MKRITAGPSHDATQKKPDKSSSFLYSPQQLAALYTGFISACLGSMAADFGQERAAQIAQIVTDNFETMDFDRETTKH